MKRSVLFLVALTAFGQTQVDLRNQAKDIDFTGAPATRPIKTGTALPATCTTGDLYFETSAPAGSNLYGCVSTNTFILQSGGGSGGSGGPTTIDNNGTVVGADGIVNFIAGGGILNTISNTGSQINIQQGVDTSVILSKATAQNGTPWLCLSASGSGTTYTCSLSPTLQAYSSGMPLLWKPDVSGSGGPTTLNVDTLGAVAVKQADGVTDPTIADVLVGRQYWVWYDGSVFRLLTPPVNVAVSGAQPSCNSSQRGRIWQTLGASGVKDSVTVCAKDATDAYAWRTIY